MKPDGLRMITVEAPDRSVEIFWAQHMMCTMYGVVTLWNGAELVAVFNPNSYARVIVCDAVVPAAANKEGPV